MIKEKEREFNYQKQSAEEIVAEVKSKVRMRKHCKRCGSVTMHEGHRCTRCS